MSALYLSMTSLFSSAFGFLFWVIAARFFDEADVGLSAALLSLVGLVGSISKAGLDVTLLRYLPVAGNRARWLFWRIVLFVTIVSIGLSIAIAVSLGIGTDSTLFNGSNLIWYGFFVALCLPNGLSTMIDLVFVVSKESKFVLARSLVAGGTKSAMLLFFGVLLLSREWILAAWFLGILVATVVSWRPLRRRLSSLTARESREDSDKPPPVTRYTAYSFIATIFGSIATLLFPIMVTEIAGPVSNAYFYVGWTVSSVTIMLPAGYSLSLVAEGASDSSTVLTVAKESIMISTVIAALLTFVLLIGGKFILGLFGPAYSAEGYPTLIGFCLASLLVPSSTAFYAVMKVKSMLLEWLVLSVITSTSTLMLAYILISGMGIIGAPIAYAAIQAGSAAYSIVRLRTIS